MGLPKLTTDRANNKLHTSGRLISCTGEVTGYTTKTTWLCLTCEHEWKTTPHVVLTSKHGCPKCCLISNNTVDNYLIRENKQIKRITNVTKSRTSVKWLCLTCEHEWKTSPNKILGKQGTGCPKCSKRSPLTNDVIDKRIIKNNLPLYRLEDISGTHTKVSWQCKNNKTHIWKTTPVSIFSKGTRCPHCYAENGGRGIPTQKDGIWFRSKLEASVYEYLKSTQYKFEQQKRYNLNTKHTCDFYIPTLQMWIEVSNYTDNNYKMNIEQKRNWVNTKGEIFHFISSSNELKHILT